MPSPEFSLPYGQEPSDQEQFFIPEVPTHAAAVAIINDEQKVLLMKRVDYGNGHGNDWVFPGGATDLGETIDQTAYREVYEESGIELDLEKNKLFPLASYITSPDAFGVKHDLIIYITKYNADQPSPYIASPAEMTDFGWFDPQEAIKKATNGEMKILPTGIFAIQRTEEYLSNQHLKQYGEVLMGGTFDRLHAGHIALLEKAFETGDYVYIGVTTDAYIAKSGKQFKGKIQPYQERLATLRNYLDSQYGLNRAITLPLEDVAGSKALDPKLGALVVSEETAQTGGIFINNLRAKYGSPPIDTVIVSLKRDESGIISSTRLRQFEEEVQN